MIDLDAIAEDVPVEYRERFVELLAEDALPLTDLADEVQGYLRTVRMVAAQVQLLQVDQAERLGQVSLALLELAGADSGPDVRRLVQAGVRYFLLEDPDEEVTGVLGLDDDVQVMNAVCRGLGRDDLVVPFRR